MENIVKYSHLVDECKKLVSDYDSPSGMLETKLKKPSNFGEMSMKKHQTTGWCERSIAMGRCVDIIDTSAENVIAYLYDFCSSQRMRINTEEGNIARLNLTDDGRQQLVATVKKVQWPLHNREFVCNVIWWNGGGGAYYLAIISVNNDIDYGASLNTLLEVLLKVW